MALLAGVIRNLRFCRHITLLTASPHVLLSLLPKFISSATHRASFTVSREFHQASCVRGQIPDLSFLDYAFGPNSGGVGCFLEEVRRHGDVNPCDREVLERIQKAKDFASGDEAVTFLDDSGIKPSEDRIFFLIWVLREEWKLAFLVYKWGEKWDCLVEKSWCLMIWILANSLKFSTAWSLIHELSTDSKDIQQAMLIMIERYAAANETDKAIRTFNLMQKFKFTPDLKTYFAFLSILCKHGNVEEAEDFMYLNKKFFPLEVGSFNIILNGWCNITIDIYEAKRVWREMLKCCIEPDGTSYTHLISCYSNVGNLFESLRLHDEMKKRGWTPGMEVYHSLVRVLTRENCLSEAVKIVDRVKEIGLEPNSATYDLMISPLCEAAKFKDAKIVLARMIRNGYDPTLDTYNAFLQGENFERTLGILKHMREVDLSSTPETFYLLLNKFFGLGEAENALKIWSQMKMHGVRPNEEHYHTLVQGLIRRGLIPKAKEFYSEIKSVDPSLAKLIENSAALNDSAKKEVLMNVVRHVRTGGGLRRWKSKVVKGEKLQKH